MLITIPGQTRAKKNSMKVITFGKRSSIRSGNLYTKWEKAAKEHLRKMNYPAWTKGYPLEIYFFLFRESKRKWDIDNIYCGCLDVLQQMNIISDDSMNHVIPYFAGWAIDKNNPRVVLKLQESTKQYFRQDLCV